MALTANTGAGLPTSGMMGVWRSAVLYRPVI